MFLKIIISLSECIQKEGGERWNRKIAEVRQKCIKTRSRTQRQHRRRLFEDNAAYMQWQEQNCERPSSEVRNRTGRAFLGRWKRMGLELGLGYQILTRKMVRASIPGQTLQRLKTKIIPCDR